MGRHPPAIRTIMDSDTDVYFIRESQDTLSLLSIAASATTCLFLLGVIGNLIITTILTNHFEDI